MDLRCYDNRLHKLPASYDSERLRRMQLRENELRHNEDDSRNLRKKQLYNNFLGGSYFNEDINQQYRNTINQLQKELDDDKSRYSSLFLLNRPLTLNEDYFKEMYEEKIREMNILKNKLCN